MNEEELIERVRTTLMRTEIECQKCNNKTLFSFSHDDIEPLIKQAIKESFKAGQEKERERIVKIIDDRIKVYQDIIDEYEKIIEERGNQLCHCQLDLKQGVIDRAEQQIQLFEELKSKLEA